MIGARGLGENVLQAIQTLEVFHDCDIVRTRRGCSPVPGWGLEDSA